MNKLVLVIIGGLLLATIAVAFPVPADGGEIHYFKAARAGTKNQVYDLQEGFTKILYNQTMNNNPSLQNLNPNFYDDFRVVDMEGNFHIPVSGLYQVHAKTYYVNIPDMPGSVAVGLKIAKNNDPNTYQGSSCLTTKSFDEHEFSEPIEVSCIIPLEAGDTIAGYAVISNSNTIDMLVNFDRAYMEAILVG